MNSSNSGIHPNSSANHAASPRAYDEADIVAWWTALPAEQKKAHENALKKLDKENKEKLQNLKKFNQPSPNASKRLKQASEEKGEYIYINTGDLPCLEMTIYDYFLMQQLVNDAQLILFSNSKLQQDIIRVTAKMGSHLFKASKQIAPTVIKSISNAAHPIVSAAGSVVQTVAHVASKGVSKGRDAARAVGDGIQSSVKKIDGGSRGGGGGWGANWGSCGGGGDAEGIMVIILIILAALIALAVAIGTAVTFAGYAIKKCCDAVRNFFRKPLEGSLTLGAVAGGTALGAIKGAVVGALIGSIVPGIGTGIGALLGAVLGACVSAGIFAGLAKGISKLVNKIKIKMGLYGDEKDIISQSNPSDYQLSNKDKVKIETQINRTIDDSTDKEIYIRMKAIHTQRNEIGIKKLLPGTDAAAEHDALKTLLLKGVKTGEALSNTAYTVGHFHFVWNSSVGRYKQTIDASASSEPLSVLRTASAA